jgi:hypothetical protein
MRAMANRLLRVGGLGTAIVAMLALMLFASPASGAERIYWPNFSTATISFANLDGSGDGTLKIDPAARINTPNAVAIDHATGRIYWSNLREANAISFANLDGSGGGTLPTGTATVNSPQGVAIDPLGGRIYWINSSANKISFANLDGSGGGDLATGIATIDRPEGLSIDPVARRIYWSSPIPGTISFANLDGPGSGDLATGNAPLEQPYGLTVDPLDHLIFWTNIGGDSIGFARLDGERGGALETGDAPVNAPRGVAVDSIGERIYWVNRDSVAFVNFDGTGGGKFDLKNASTQGPMFPALLLSPRPLGFPAISGPTTAGSVLTCNPPEWASELLDTSLEAPGAVRFQWSLNETEIPGATTSSVTAANPDGGEYSCRVTAENRAGARTETSAPRFISPLPPARPHSFGRFTRVTIGLSSPFVPSRGPVPVKILNGNPFAVTGVLSGRSTSRTATGHRRQTSLGVKAFAVVPFGKTIVELKLPRPLRLALAHKHRLSLLLRAVVSDSTGNHRTVQRFVVATQRR